MAGALYKIFDILRNFIYLEVLNGLGSIESNTAYSDLQFLFLVARDGKGEGAIVEIGGFTGKSAVAMALGSKWALREKIISIDPHYRGTKDVFIENIRRKGVADYIEPVFAASEDARKGFKKNIRLLFVDGNHDYEFVKKDILLWKDLVIDGGIIVFHDINWETVAKALDEFVMRSPEFVAEETVGCSLIVSKGRSANKALIDEVKIFNSMKDLLRPWKPTRRKWGALCRG